MGPELPPPKNGSRSAGTYAVASGGGCKCGACAAGSVDQDANPATRCVACSVGQYAAAGRTACSACASGFADTDRNASTPCSACPAGQHSASDVGCTPCAAGRYDHDLRSSSACLPCAAGRFVAGVAAGARTCGVCAAGKHAAAGASECTLCGKNHEPDMSRAMCAPCRSAEYSDPQAGVTACTPDGSTATAGSPERACGQPANTFCAGPATAPLILPAIGWWFNGTGGLNATQIGGTLKVSSCDELGQKGCAVASTAGAALAALAACNASGEAAAGCAAVRADDARFGCKPFHTGPLCAGCTAGYANVQGSCVECRWSTARNWMLALSFGVYMLLGAWIMSQGLTPDKNNTAASVAFFAQTLSLLHFERTLAVVPFDALLRVLSLDVGLASFFDSGCAAPLDFKTSWLLEVLVHPAFLVFGAWCFIKWRGQGQPASKFGSADDCGLTDLFPSGVAEWKLVGSAWLHTLVFAYGPITLRALRLLRCEHVPGALSAAGASLLVADPTMECYAAGLLPLQLFAWFLVTVFGLGVPLALLLLLRAPTGHLADGTPRRGHLLRDTSSALKPLHHAFRPEWRHWSALQLLRRGLLECWGSESR